YTTLFRSFTRSAAPSPVRVRNVPSKASNLASDPARSRQASNRSYATARDADGGSSTRVSPTTNSASGSANGGGVSRAASATAKIDAPTPIVSASVSTAAAALMGD